MQPASNSSHLDKEHGRALVSLARNTIAAKFGVPSAEVSAEDHSPLLSSQQLQVKRGTFVTLKKEGQLRGCIGTLTDADSIVDGVKKNAINAAFHDFRFNPLSADEFADIEIEISILTKPYALTYTDGDDLCAKLRPQLDGVILRKGPASATFLPQVWDQLPHAEEFLSQLCLKAGLSSEAWRATPLNVSVYQVQHFSER